MFAKLKSFLAPPVFADEELTRKAKTLNFILIPAMLNIVVVLVTGINESVGGGEAPLIGMLIFQGILFFALRRGYVEAVGSLLVISAWLIVSFMVWHGNGIKDSIVLAYFALMLMASLITNRWVTLLITGLTIAVGWAFVYGESVGLITPVSVSPATLMTQHSFSYVFSGILAYLVVSGFQNAVARVQESNQSLQQLSQQLEQRVQVRTRELAVAAEVGRRISQMQDLDKLLTESVELIRERFGLYHVQIYLADAAGQNLNLRASTGSVGRELLKRGHKLPVRPGSINGAVAFNKEPVLVADTANNPLFRKNMLLPFTRSELAVPLRVGDQLVGVLDLQSEQAQALSSENLSLYGSLADQLAVAVDNAYLLRRADEARQEVERYVRLVSHENLAEVPDGAERKETIGVRYDLNTLEGFDGPIEAALGSHMLRVPITVADTTIGTILLESEEKQAWTAETQAMVEIIAQQVGRQAENLRLLNESKRYRAEAEQAARQMSGQAWREYLSEQQDQAKGFVYTDDVDMVTLLTENDLSEELVEAAIRQPLKIRNEAIGEFVVSGVNKDEAQALLAIVANQLSNHIENIRLAERTEAALEESESLYQIGHELNRATNVDEILHASLGPIFPTGIDEATLMFIELDRQGQPQTLELLAGWRMDGNLSFPVGTIFPMKRFPFTGLFINSPDRPQLIGEANTDPRVDDFTRGVMAHAGIKAIAVIPLRVGGHWVGIITCSWPQPRTFSKQEEEIFSALINMAAPAVESQRLYYKTKEQAEKERSVNEINQRILNTESMESALQTAVKELGQTLKTTTQIKLKTGTEKNQTNHNQAKAVTAD